MFAKLAFAATTFLLTASAAAAQTPVTPASPNRTWEFLITSGTLVPTGAEKADVRRGNISATQVSRHLTPRLTITGSAGWGRLRATAPGAARLDVFTYDAGAEVRGGRAVIGRRVTVTPFAGAGAGGRTYSYRHAGPDATHSAALYASAGAEVGVWRVRVRLEARDYVGVAGVRRDDRGAASRNDVAFLAGLRFGR
jgi:hypothetical protein